MTGEYNINIIPNDNESWRDAKTLRTELTIEIDGEQRKYSGTSIRMG